MSIDCSTVKVSIIVPVYNKEKYLIACVASLRAQTHHNLEIILVDDGSTDESGTLCDIIQAQDNRVHVLHQLNQGVSMARNAGIAAATGQYIQFCDSDDSVLPTMTQRLLEEAIHHASDLAICGIKQCWKNKSKDCNLLESQKGSISLNLFFAGLAQYHCHEYFGSNCNKLYRTELVKSGVFFEADLCFAEDFLFNLSYFQQINSVCVVQDALYLYNKQVANSLTKKRIDITQTWKDCKKAYQAFTECFQKVGYYEVHKKDVQYFLLFLLDWTFLRQPLLQLWKQRKQVKTLCLLPEVQRAAKEAKRHKITVEVFRFALRTKCWVIIYLLRFARKCLGIN